MKLFNLCFFSAIMICFVLVGCTPNDTATTAKENIQSSSQETQQKEKTDKSMKTVHVDSLEYYLVETEEDLRAIGSKDYPLSCNYMLNCDITLTQNWTPIGKDDSTPFTGRFDGNGFKISNVTIDDKEATYKYVGFFGLVDGGTLHNIHLKNVSISTARDLSEVVVAPKTVVAATVLDGEMTNCKIEI